MMDARELDDVKDEFNGKSKLVCWGVVGVVKRLDVVSERRERSAQRGLIL